MPEPVPDLIHGFMIWNLFLAAIPVALAVVLFRPQSHRGAAWWLGVGVWVLFLPNAPYVLTDVVHMFDDMQGASDRYAFAAVVVYGAFFAAGLACYVVALGLLERYLGPLVRTRWIVLALLVLHGLSAVAIYIGRFLRWNSWDVMIDPGGIAAWPNELTHRFAVATILATFVILTVAWFAMRSLVVELVGDGRRVVRYVRRVVL